MATWPRASSRSSTKTKNCSPRNGRGGVGGWFRAKKGTVSLIVVQPFQISGPDPVRSAPGTCERPTRRDPSHAYRVASSTRHGAPSRDQACPVGDGRAIAPHGDGIVALPFQSFRTITPRLSRSRSVPARAHALAPRRTRLEHRTATRHSQLCTKKWQNALCGDFCVKSGSRPALLHRLSTAAVDMGPAQLWQLTYSLVDTCCPRWFFAACHVASICTAARL
jgi:hypothetical protein